MRRTAAILTLVVAVSLLGASDVRAGAALVPAGKTTGSTLTATVVLDVTDVPCPTCVPPCLTCTPTTPASTKGQTTIRAQKASTSRAVMFTSSYVRDIHFIPGTCVNITFNNDDLVGSTAYWFT